MAAVPESERLRKVQAHPGSSVGKGVAWAREDLAKYSLAFLLRPLLRVSRGYYTGGVEEENCFGSIAFTCRLSLRTSVGEQRIALRKFYYQDSGFMSMDQKRPIFPAEFLRVASAFRQDMANIDSTKGRPGVLAGSRPGGPETDPLS
jgi:hypothetical protein